MLDVLKYLGGPGGMLVFLYVCLFVGVTVLFVSPRYRRLAKVWLLSISGVYLVLGLPVIANAIAGGLPRLARANGPKGPSDAIVVFDGDNRRGRLRTTLELLETAASEQVWVLGEDWLVLELIAAGVPGSLIHHEAESRNTREQVAWTRAFVDAHPGSRPAVVVSRLQAPRVAALAAANGLDIALAPSPIDIEPPTRGWRAFVPMYAALRTSRDAIYEHAALAYYRRNGWIGD